MTVNFTVQAQIDRRLDAKPVERPAGRLSLGLAAEAFTKNPGAQMKVMCGPDVLTDELEILVALAESIRCDRDAWRNAACRLAEAYAAAAGVHTGGDGFDLPSIEFLIEEIREQPVSRVRLQGDRRQIH